MIAHNVPHSECKGYYEGYIDGAKYADSTMIENAFMWFSKNIFKYIDAHPIGTCATDINININDMWQGTTAGKYASQRFSACYAVQPKGCSTC